MSLWLAHWLGHFYHGFSVLAYLSVRYIFSALTALLVVLIVGKPLIRWLQRQQIGQVVREDGPQSHYSKRGTPTMGGVLIIGAVVLSSLLWCDLSNLFVWLSLLVFVGFGAIGWWDDYLKLVLKHSRGMKSRWKFALQSLLGLVVGVVMWWHFKAQNLEGMVIPFVSHYLLHFGWGMVIFYYFVIVGASNAVNLTDGLDGLAILPSVVIALALLIFAYLTGNTITSDYLLIPYVPGASEVGVVCAALMGAGLGFLWYNAYPAQVFMGDVGALAIGGLLAVVAIVVKQEIVFAIMGGVFVLEAVSVILQVGSYKLRKKRIFKMAPIHHHFELSGWSEPKIIVRFWVITLVLVLVGLASLKIR